jgi:hypothetical protein
MESSHCNDIPSGSRSTKLLIKKKRWMIEVEITETDASYLCFKTLVLDRIACIIYLQPLRLCLSTGSEMTLPTRCTTLIS